MMASASPTASSKRCCAELSRTVAVITTPVPRAVGSSADILRPPLSGEASLRHLPDPGIAGKDEPAGPYRGRLEIRVVGRQNLPLRRLLAENPDRPHPWEFPPQ